MTRAYKDLYSGGKDHFSGGKDHDMDSEHRLLRKWAAEGRSRASEGFSHGQRCTQYF